MKQQIHLSQKQSQKLSPQLQFTLKLLQYTQAELEQEIEQALALNPVLERVDTNLDADTNSDSSPANAVTSDANENADFEAGDTHASDDEPDDHDADRFGEFGKSPATKSWETQSETPDLQQHLREQVQLSKLTARDRTMADAVLDSLEDDGYCLTSAGEIAEATGLNPSPTAAEIETIRHFIRQLDPLGVAARSLAECLQVQLDVMDVTPELRKLAHTIAEQHLSLVAKGAVAELAFRLKATPDLTSEAVCLLKSLDPKPGARFHQSHTEYIEPDFYALKRQSQWQIQIHAENMGKLRINRLYKQLASSGQSQAQHLAPYLQDANRLLAAIKARQDTLKRVLQALCLRQQAFFEQGPAALAPMRLIDIAEELGMHESTISRACSGKYLATRHGLFALNRLFRSGLPGQGGLVQSSNALQARIATLIAAENPYKPLSDAQLQAAFQAEGLQMARRTITKYREALKIAPSHLRRKRD